jgi:hypothetical protein
MKKTLKAATLAVTIAVVSPTFVYAAPQPRAEWKDFGDNPVVRAVQSIKKVIVRVLEGPMIPPPVPPAPTP